ncbi:hypothetical protein AMJ87_11115 [candidate division WOR_3 bacterium SM23_60]|uniref:Outer membrane protein beta-barrel domain-containing protein n=1 Tax=candidate division WOR_3 bacterium SM23_60 TaxID=1703780 RepID=A0A0S8G7E9_UNCW3|nr:MAG: hypothetical protein AMJ87_11115 [candidate division WOR_3 bacterium SM23_60]
MKRLIIVAVLFVFITTASAFPVKKSRKPLVEFGPKANLYIGSVRFGIGAELIVNPLRNLGIRMDLVEFSFGDDLTEFYMNYGGSLDALIHFPAQSINPYFYGGFSLFSFDRDRFSDTYFTFRFGLGLEHAWDRNTNVFVEPGLIIADAGGNTETIFRLSAGARLGILR